MSKILILCLIAVLFYTLQTEAQLSKPCVLNGVSYRYGEKTVEMQANGMLYRCTCILLFNDRVQRRCNSSAPDAHLILADVTNIRKFALGDAHAFAKPFIKSVPKIAVSVDVDVKHDYIYWTDVSFNMTGIYRARFSDGLDASNRRIEKIISTEVAEPNGIAVDWLSSHIYWTDAQLGAIYVSHSDGRNRARLIGGLSAPRGIALVPTIGEMFWTDPGRGTIERAKMDGTNYKIIFSNLISPNEIVVSKLNRHVFWIDGESRKIERCDFDGSFSSYKKIYDFTESGSPAAYGLAIFENRLYFALWDKQKIYSITLEGSDWNVASAGIGTRPMGLSIVNHDVQTYGRLSNPCWSENSCSHLCLPKSHVAYRCACPSNSGLVLSSDQRSCKVPDEFLLFTSLDEGTVMVISMDQFTDRHPVVLAQADRPVAVDFDPVEQMVYWSDIGMNGIYRKPFSSKQPELFMRDGIENVEGIAIDATNRHLYFTNVGWEGEGKWFHRIELIELDEPHKRKILTTHGFDKPRDVTIDVPAGFLYVSDWGKDPKIVRLDLDGKHPYELPLVVENPNGVVSVGKDIYFTDSHYNSADRTENGTMIFNQFARVARYNQKQEDLKEIRTVTSETPFGLTYGGGRLFMTDWGLGGIYEIDVVYSKEPKGSRELAVGISKPTGIKYATLQIPTSEKEEEEEGEGICESEESSMCKQICVPVGEEEFTCVCSDFGVTVLSDNQHRCVEADEFILVADRVRVLMRSLRPNDENSYIVVGGHDILSNIIAVTYDPVNKLIYWADSGRKRIGRKFLEGNSGGSIQREQTIYTDISLVEGMALDSQQQLLYWTDAVKGTIEVLDVSTPAFKHAVILSNLHNPRGITLNTKQGLMYWTEVGLHPGVFEAGMNGQNSRQIINGGITIPNGIFFNTTTNLFWVCDGNNINVQSYASQGDGSALALDYSDFHGIASHIYGVAEMGNSFIISDWKQQSVILVKDFETETLIDDMYRPSQLHLQQLFTFPGPSTICFEDTCSHVCVPDGSSFACVCPEHLVLDSDLRTCITEERAKRMEQTFEMTTSYNINTTTFPWADLTTAVTTQATTTETTTEIQTTTKEETTKQATTTQATTETQTTTTATTTPPGPPYFTSCGEEVYKFALSNTNSKVAVTADDMKIYAYDGHGTKLPIKVKGIETSSIDLGASRQSHKIILYAMDAYGRIIQCQVDVRILDRTPPRVVECPQDMNIDSFHADEIAYVTWETPKFEDNSGLELRVLSSKTPGFFSRGIHNITYTAMDLDENKVTCSFLISITKMDNICGEPYQPPNSRLMCTSSNRRETDIRQTCNVTCTDDYYLTLAHPQVQCLGADDIWLPHLHDRVCQKPTTGNVRQKVHIKYPCPCVDSTTFYEQSLEALAAKVKTKAECSTRKPKLGLCKDAKNKLSLNCQEENTLEVIVTVDLASSKDVTTTEQARSVVRRSSSELMRMFESGGIQAEGTDKKMYVAKAYSDITDFEVICPSGHINSTKGCIPCPPGTYLVNNKCVFCPLHYYQAREAQTFCYECAKHKGTTLRGSQHISNCKPMTRVRITSDDNNMFLYIVIPIVGGMFLLLATCFIIFFVVRRRKNNKIKKQREEELRKKKEEIMEMRQLRKSVRNRSQRRSRRSQRRPAVVHENRPVTNPEHTRNAGVPAQTPKPQKKRAAPGVEEAKKQQQPNKEKVDERSNDDRESNVSQQSSKVTTDWDDEKSVGAESAIFTDMTTGSETGSGVSSLTTTAEKKPPPQRKRVLKSALKKPPRVLSDDETTVISATSLDRGQLQQLNKRTRSNSLDRDHRTRGRGRRLKTADEDDDNGGDISRTSSIRSILKKDRGDVRNPQYSSFGPGTLPSRSLSQVSTSTYGTNVRPPPRGPPGPMGMRLPRMPRSRSDYGMRPLYPPGMGPGPVPRMRMRGPHGPVGDRYPPPPPSDLSVDHRPRYPGYWGGPRDPSVRYRSLPPRMRIPPRYGPPMTNGVRLRNPSQPPRYLPPLHLRYY